MIGNYLKEKRIQKKIPFETVSSLLGVKEDYVTFLENGQIYSFGENRIKAIIKAYALNENETKEFLELVNN